MIRQSGSILLSVSFSMILILLLAIWAMESSFIPDPAHETGETRLIARRLQYEQPTLKKSTRNQTSAGALLLVPDSTNKRVMAFNPLDGNLVNTNFIPPDPDNLSFPMSTILSPGGDSILVSDYSSHLVVEYDFDGTFLGIFAPAGGPNPSQLSYPRGMSLDADNHLLVAMSANPEIDTVVEFDENGNYLGQFIASGSGGLDSPYDIEGRTADWLVGGAASDAIHQYDLDGNYLTDLTPIDNFPQQIALASGGNILVANFSGAQRGILEFTAQGLQVGHYEPISDGYRGVYELPNGNLLASIGTNPGGVYEIDRAGNLVDTKVLTGTPRYIELVQIGDLLIPTITLTKTVGFIDQGCPMTEVITVAAGSQVNYCYRLLNNGNVSVTNHVVDDDILGTIWLSPTFEMKPGAAMTLTQIYTVIETVTNSASWSAISLSGVPVIASDTAHVRVMYYLYLLLIRRPPIQDLLINLDQP